MSFTPSNLAITNLGAIKLTVATQNISTASGTDLWTSGIPDIQSIIPIYTSSLSGGFPTDVSFAVSFTQSSGVVHLLRNNGMSASSFVLLVLSGFVSDF